MRACIPLFTTLGCRHACLQQAGACLHTTICSTWLQTRVPAASHARACGVLFAALGCRHTCLQPRTHVPARHYLQHLAAGTRACSLTCECLRCTICNTWLQARVPAGSHARACGVLFTALGCRHACLQPHMRVPAVYYLRYLAAGTRACSQVS